MNVATMHLRFDIGLDKIASFNYASFTAEEKDVFLNDAQEKFIEQRAYGTNPKGTGLEEDQKRRDDLREIIKNYTTTTFTTSSNNKTNGSFVALPSDYRHAIQEEVNISYTDCNDAAQTKRVPVTPVTHDRYNKIINDPFNQPYEDEAIRLDYEGDVFEIITDGTYTLSNYYLRYLKEPQTIRYGTQYLIPTTDVDCELANHCHREIISLAVFAALEDIESKRYITQKQEIKEIE